MLYYIEEGSASKVGVVCVPACALTPLRQREEKSLCRHGKHAAKVHKEVELLAVPNDRKYSMCSGCAHMDSKTTATSLRCAQRALLLEPNLSIIAQTAMHHGWIWVHTFGELWLNPHQLGLVQMTKSIMQTQSPI